MKKSGLQNRTYSQLMSLAAQAGIVGRSRLTKAQLIVALSSRRAPVLRPRSATAKSRTRHREPAELPAQYGRTRVILMEIDPYRVHAFWEITPADYEAAIKRLGRQKHPASWILRFQDVTEPNETDIRSHFDVSIDSTAGNWYVNMPASGRSYMAEIGPCTAQHRFEPVSRSNTVHIPPAQESAHYDPEWLRVEGGMESVERVSEPEPESPSLPSTDPMISILTSRPDPSIPFLVPTMLPGGDQESRPTYAAEAESSGYSEWPTQMESSMESYGGLAAGSWSQGGATSESAREFSAQLPTEVIAPGRTHRGQRKGRSRA